MGGACSVGINPSTSQDQPKFDINNTNKNKLKSLRSFTRLNKSNSNSHQLNNSVQSQASQKGSFLERTSIPGLEKAVDVLDALGSGMTNLNNSGFLTAKPTKGNNISILAFEVANTITRGANLLHSLSDDSVRFIKQELVSSEGVQYLVSTDMKVLLSLAASDKREELDVFCKEVIRFGNLCKDPQWHNLERFFSKLDSENAVYRQKREQADAKMQELMNLAMHTSELYHELNMFDRVEQDYRQKVEEMKSLNLPRKGEHFVMLQGEVRQQKKIVLSLKKKSLWSKRLEEVVEKLVDIVAFIHQQIIEVFEPGGTKASAEIDRSMQRLGPAGLALHYANIINNIDNIASRPNSLPPNIRDTLYQGLPADVKASLCSSLRKLDPVDEVDVPKIKAEMENILEWLSPIASNTLKAHQGFGWVGEWANASIEFNKKTAGNGNLIRLQTLYHADKKKMDSCVLKLVLLLHQLISGIRQRDHGRRTLPFQSPSKKIVMFNPPMKMSSPPYDINKTPRIELSEEDRGLLERMSKSRSAPGISKSQEFTKKSERVTKSWKWSRSFKISLRKERQKTYPELLEHDDLDLMRGGLEAPF